jgi:nitrogen regulatory protein PII
MADEIVRVIESHAHTGNRGDGKILVVKASEAVRIRTGERGSAAIAPSLRQ